MGASPRSPVPSLAEAQHRQRRRVRCGFRVDLSGDALLDLLRPGLHLVLPMSSERTRIGDEISLHAAEYHAGRDVLTLYLNNHSSSGAFELGETQDSPQQDGPARVSLLELSDLQFRALMRYPDTARMLMALWSRVETYLDTLDPDLPGTLSGPVTRPPLALAPPIVPHWDTDG